jgi:hypothetical protein
MQCNPHQFSSFWGLTGSKEGSLATANADAVMPTRSSTRRKNALFFPKSSFRQQMRLCFQRPPSARRERKHKQRLVRHFFTRVRIQNVSTHHHQHPLPNHRCTTEPSHRSCEWKSQPIKTGVTVKLGFWILARWNAKAAAPRTFRTRRQSKSRQVRVQWICRLHKHPGKNLQCWRAEFYLVIVGWRTRVRCLCWPN